MAVDDKSDKGEKSGLLSKVVRFVTQPMSNWSDLDESDEAADTRSGRDRIKELAERKKRNDFVRRREFSMLRKIRRKQLRDSPDALVRPSFFQSSLTSRPDERVRTLEKIDEIEAQMSMQWWKSKADTTRPGALPDPIGTSRLGRPSAMHAPPSESGGLPSTTRQVLRGEASPSTLFGTPTLRQGEPDPKFDSTRRSVRIDQQAPAAAPPGAGARAGASASDDIGFSASKIFAIEVDEGFNDPGLEEAAIRFANGDNAGAEAALRELIADQENGTPAPPEAWLALFDYYRATGWQEPFETLALDYVGRFGRSPPQWFSLPEKAGHARAVRQAAAPLSRRVHWICPAVLSAAKLAGMVTVLSRIAPPQRIDWSPLTVVEPDALGPLTAQLRDWAAGSSFLEFKDGERLERVLAVAAPSGDSQVDPAWWLARLECLRLLGRMDDFEVVALDYCVTYEVSPPAWEPPLSQAMPLGEEAPAAAPTPAESPSSGPASEFATSFLATQIGIEPTRVGRAELSGECVGEVGDPVAELDRAAEGFDVVEVNCERLIRMDFAAAGALLNWITAQQAQGRLVAFIAPHRLVAAFFHVIGITDSARVVPRMD